MQTIIQLNRSSHDYELSNLSHHPRLLGFVGWFCLAAGTVDYCFHLAGGGGGSLSDYTVSSQDPFEQLAREMRRRRMKKPKDYSWLLAALLALLVGIIVF